tara:strand:+ start:9388 stop:10638 length:1251 start_codon:yes stop_codon:yes gene_type:complete
MDLIKKYNNVVLFFLDIALTVICASVVYLILHHDIAKESLQLWVISMILFWQVTREPEKIFIQGYRHIIRLLFFAVSATVIYLFIFRISYSLRALVSVSFLWMIFASLGRFLLIKYLPNRIIAGDKDIIDKLMDDEKIKNNKLFSVLTLTDLSKLDFKDFDYVIFDPQHDYDEKWRNFFVHAKVAGIPVYAIYEIEEVIQGKVSVELLKQNWIANNFVLNKLYLNIKRFLDILFCLITAVITIPVMLIIALIIRVNMGKKVVFSQQRIGFGGDLFWIYKFRTMVLDYNDSEKKETQGEDDPRITKLGKFLRKTRLDELPQLYNILKGNMSLIGPRPEWEATANKFAEEIPLYYLRNMLRPGVTGWAQVNQGHTTGVKGNYEKLRYDIYYIKNCSIWIDLKILLRTIYIVISGHGAV